MNDNIYDVTVANVKCPNCDHRFAVKVDGDEFEAFDTLSDAVVAHFLVEHEGEKVKP